MNEEQPKVKRGRGPGKKPRLFCTSLRMDKTVLDYYKTFPNPQVKMREVLTEFVNQTQTQSQGATNGPQ
jgi:uncharacterized protein (DUF4415 family)